MSNKYYKLYINPVIDGDKYQWMYTDVSADGNYVWHSYSSAGPVIDSGYGSMSTSSGRMWKCIVTTSDGLTITSPDHVVKPYDLNTSQFLTFVSQIFTFLLSFVSTLITFILGNPFLAVLLVLFLCGTVITFLIV